MSACPPPFATFGFIIPSLTLSAVPPAAGSTFDDVQREVAGSTGTVPSAVLSAP